MGDYYDLEDRISFYDFFYDLIIAVLLLFYGIYVIVRVAINCRQQYIDILKIVQLLLLLGICLTEVILFLVQLLTYTYQNQVILIIFVYSVKLKIAFVLFTQFSWYILTRHLAIYKIMTKGASFSDWKLQVQKIEKTGVLIVIIANVVLYITSLVLGFMRYYYDLYYLSAIIEFITLFVNLTLTITEFFLYKTIKKVMNNSLNFYYQKYKYSIRYVSLVSFWYLIETNVWNIVGILYTFTWVYYENARCSKMVSDYFIMAQLILQFIQFVLLFIYSTYHSHNIEFGEWMLDLMIGHKQINRYGECSIFIYRSNRKTKDKYEDESDVFQSFNNNEDDIDEASIDYDDSNHYMKAYLTKFQKSESNKDSIIND